MNLGTARDGTQDGAARADHSDWTTQIGCRLLKRREGVRIW